MRKILNTSSTGKLLKLCLAIWLLSGISNMIHISLVAADSNDPLRAGENISPIVERNQGNQLTWEVKRSVGIFALQKFHIRDQIKMTINEANIAGRYYSTTQERLYWRQNRTEVIGENISSSYFVLNRDWAKSVKSEIIMNASLYWCRHPAMLEYWALKQEFVIPGTNKSNPAGQDVLNYFVQLEADYNKENPGASYSFWDDDETYVPELIIFTRMVLSDYSEEIFTTSSYNNIWQFSRIITVMTLNITLDEKNFDIYRYTREEGILLSRHTEINIDNGTEKDIPLMGTFELNLIDFTTEFKVSFYHYLAWFGIIFGSIMISVIVISQIIAARQRKIRMLDY